MNILQNIKRIFANLLKEKKLITLISPDYDRLRNELTEFLRDVKGFKEISIYGTNFSKDRIYLLSNRFTHEHEGLSYRTFYKFVRGSDGLVKISAYSNLFLVNGVKPDNEESPRCLAQVELRSTEIAAYIEQDIKEKNQGKLMTCNFTGSLILSPDGTKGIYPE